MNIKKKFIHKEVAGVSPRGFTFVEVIMVVAIISIMTGVALVSMNSARTNKALETAGQEVAATIREAQNYALTGKGAGAGCNDYTFTYAAGDSYGISNGAACSINVNYTLKNGVTFPSGDLFSFSAPHGAVDFTGLKTIILAKNGKQIRVCVYSSGRVEETVIGAASCP